MILELTKGEIFELMVSALGGFLLDEIYEYAKSKGIP